MRHRFVKDNLSQFRVTTMCRVLRVSTSGFYAWQGRSESERAVRSRALVKRIVEVYKKSGSTDRDAFTGSWFVRGCNAPEAGLRG